MTEIIADISGNHGGSLEKAKDLIRAAADCGCNYAKFQYYSPHLMPDQENREIYDKLYILKSWLLDLFEEADRVKIPLFASIFDEYGIEDLELYGPPFYKIASPESTRLKNYEDLIRRTRRESGLIISTGIVDYYKMRSLADLYGAYLLYCPAGHPCPASSAHLQYYVVHKFDGLSDHCADLTTALQFVGREVKFIERHIKLDDDCIDAAFSSNPAEMAELCKLASQS